MAGVRREGVCGQPLHVPTSGGEALGPWCLFKSAREVPGGLTGLAWSSSPRARDSSTHTLLSHSWGIRGPWVGQNWSCWGVGGMPREEACVVAGVGAGGWGPGDLGRGQSGLGVEPGGGCGCPALEEVGL